MSNDILEQLENEVFKEEKTKQQIESKISTNSTDTSNERKAIKAKFTQLLYSNKLIEDEKEGKKDIYKSLKDEHGISNKVAKKVEKLLEKGSVTEFEEEQLLVATLYEKVRS